ncbi:MAG: hypothetical protein ACT4PM_15425 [Gemmatimonadales bacterium]
MTTLSITLPFATRSALWRAARIAGLLLTIVLLVALWREPQLTLHVLWDMVIPLLPAVFLLNPIIWRNVCPLASLNAFSGKRVGTRFPGRTLARGSWIGGLVLLGVMVPARRFLFNEDGLALLVTIAVVGYLALVMGLAFSRRSGFCNAWCPVLPVEKLYGQAPLLAVPTARCASCNLCSPARCIELSGGKSLVQSFGRVRRRETWYRSPLGVFAAAFPGFVIGYFTTENGLLASAPEVYLRIGAWSLASFGLVAMSATILGLAAARMLPVLGALAFALYYWFSAPTLTEAYGLAGLSTTTLRVAALGLVTFWLVRALRRVGAPPRTVPSPDGT